MANGDQQTVDYEALARKTGAIGSQPASQRGSVDYAALAKQAGATDSQPPQQEQSTMQKVGSALEGFGTGALKGAGHTLGGLSPLINKIPYVGETLAPSSGIKAWENLTKPEGTAQKIGFGTEQAAEFLLPTGLEEKAGVGAATLLPKLGKAAPVLGRLGTGALTTGAVNKLQGGSFGEGALLGAGTGAVGEAGRAVAPSLAESALGVTKRLRGFGRTPGKAALEETRGFLPGTVAESARGTLDDLTSQLEQHAAQSTIATSTAPAVAVVDREMSKAAERNSKTLYDQLNAVREQLTTDFRTGQPLGGQLSASKLLNLKRGIGELEGSWNPETRGALKGIVRKVYRALDDELDRAVPESANLNQRISSLIPVAQRAESTERGAEVGQRVMHRVAAHTGALAGSGVGGVLGYKRGGWEGAGIGAAAGLALPELMASPSAQMLGARALQSRVPQLLGRGAGSQLLGRKTPFGTDEEGQ